MLRILNAICEQVERYNAKDWCIALDGNANMLQGPCQELIARVGGTCVATAGHKQSSCPIDGIWVSPNLEVVSCHHNKPGDGDHGVSLNLKIPKIRERLWRFSHTPKIVFPEENNPHVPWSDVATNNSSWRRSLEHVEYAWNTWSSDVTKWLYANDFIASQTWERNLGTIPHVKHSSHRMGIEQDIHERQLRRWIRRLQEAQQLALRGKTLPEALRNRLQISQVPTDESEAVKNRRWGLAQKLAQDRLHVMLKKKQSQKLSDWKTRMHTLPGACRWLKQEAPIPNVLCDNHGQILTCATAMATELKNFWSHIFGTSQEPVDDTPFWETFEPFLPAPQTPPSLPKFSGSHLRKVAKAMCGKAAGLDGISAKTLATLPLQALDRLAQVLDLCEMQGHWPQGLLQWKLVFLPKTKNGKIPSLADVRPISIAPVLYRMWGRIRLQQLSTLLTTTLAPYQSGGVGGPDVVSLLLSYDVEFSAEEFGCVAALDFAKAFDSCDTSLVLSTFDKIGIPHKIVRLLADQWTQHSKWVTFANSVCLQPMTHTRGLPQGDPWSPVGISLILSLAKKRADQLVPEARSLLYLDDRTILAPNPVVLKRALQAWDVLYECTRLKDNHSKRQFLARCPTLYHPLVGEGFPASPTIEVLGVTLGCGPRKRSQAEVDRATKVNRISKRLFVLPVSQTFKSCLAATVMAPLAVWGSLLNGRVPTKDENSRFLSMVLTAVRHTVSFQSGGGSTCLRQCLLAGHTSDLRFYAAQRLLAALHKWRSSRNVDLSQRRTPMLLALSKCLSSLNCTMTHPGSWSHSQGNWDTTAPLGFSGRLAHCFRQHWRLEKIKSWLYSQRRDAQLAQQQGLRPTLTLVDGLRRDAKTLDAWELGVACGGLHSEAQCDEACRPTQCPHCFRNECPSTFHILWTCPRWTHLRVRTQPRNNPFLARMGWDQNGINKRLIRQFGAIRREHAATKRLLSGGGGVCHLRTTEFVPCGARCYHVLGCSDGYDDLFRI